MMADPYRIFKYPVSLTDAFTVSMPDASQILSVQMQGDAPYMWAFVNPDAPKVDRHFRLVGTGHPVTMDERFHLMYIGTFQLHGGSLVFHLFEVHP